MLFRIPGFRTPNALSCLDQGEPPTLHLMVDQRLEYGLFPTSFSWCAFQTCHLPARQLVPQRTVSLG